LNKHKPVFQLLFTCLMLLAGTSAFAQNLNKKITLEVHNQPLGEVIRQISQKGDILFSYNPNRIPLDKKITITVKNATLESIFVKVFINNGIEYVVSEKQVILKPAAQPAQTENQVTNLAVRKFTVSGYVRDKATGEAIIGANVYNPATMQGTASNAYGFYSLSLPAGDYTLTYSFIGYTPVEKQIKFDKNNELTIDLEIASVAVKSVTIYGNTDDNLLKINQSGDMHLSPSVLKQIPGFAGNVDVLKSIQNVPGIISFGDGSAFYYVRGGNSDQNLLLIDEAPIYNPTHMFGFFSALAPDAIKDVMVYKGDFPASYGGRLSSVVEVRARDGNLKNLSFAGNMGIYTTDLTLEGPIVKEKSSFLVSGRISNLNWLKVSNAYDQSYKFNFYDVNAKFNVRLNKNNRLFLTAYTGNDVFERYNSLNKNVFGISWDNIAGTLRWNHTFNNRLFCNTTMYYSRYDYYLDIAKELKNYWNSSITNATIKTDFSYYLNLSNTIKTGFEINGHNSNPGNMHYSDEGIQASIPQISKYKSTEVCLYAANEQLLGKHFSARYGLRLSHWNDFGPASVYFFDANHKVIDTIDVAAKTIYESFNNIEPRVTLKLLMGNNASVQVSYNHTVQHLQVLSNSTSPFTSLEVWVPSGPNIKPQQADQFSVGYFSRIPRRQLEITVEAYYKKLYNQVDYADHANMLYNPLIEGELRFGDGYAYGIETMLRKNTGKFTGWVSYTYSKAIRQTDGVNNGNRYPAINDRPHNLFITLCYNSGKRWSYSAHWMYLTGAPFSSPTGFYYVNGYSIPIYGEKNNDRYPDYHRLDLSVAFALNKPEKKFRHSLMLTIYNAYGRHNPFSQNFNKIIDDNGNFVVPANLEGDIERVPTCISVAGTIPSLNYTFRF